MMPYLDFYYIENVEAFSEEGNIYKDDFSKIFQDIQDIRDNSFLDTDDGILKLLAIMESFYPDIVSITRDNKTKYYLCEGGMFTDITNRVFSDVEREMVEVE